MAFTFFFRDQSMLNMIIAHALPELKKYRYIRIWDAGCAAGHAVIQAFGRGDYKVRRLVVLVEGATADQVAVAAVLAQFDAA